MATDPWLVTWNPTARARLRLLCLPHAGGGPSTFRRWAEGLPLDVELMAVHPPGRERRLREPPLERLETLVDAIGEAFRPFAAAPYALFGHSLGALVAFELARRLRARTGTEPLHLFVSAHRAPDQPHSGRALAGLSDGDLIEQVHGFGGIPDALLRERELLDLVLPALRADITAGETYVYQPSPPLTCPITALGGEADHRVPLSHLTGWQALTTGRFAVRLFPGGHFYLQERQDEVVRHVHEALAPMPSSVSREDQ